jgi:hypothetical protein
MSLDTTKVGRQSETTIAPLSEAAARASLRPESFRLPKSGGDPHFGIGRSFYYRGEQLGYWRLIRIRERGKQRGITFVPYDQVAAFVRKQMEAA